MNFFAFTGFGTINPGYLTGSYDPSVSTGTGLAIFIKNLLNTTYVVAGLATFIYLAIAGFKYITAGGDVKAMQEASKQITGAIVGLAIVVVSYVFVLILGVVLGVPIFNPTFKGPLNPPPTPAP